MYILRVHNGTPHEANRHQAARQTLPDLIDRAEAGEEIIITRQGKPVAKLGAAPRIDKPLPSLAAFRKNLGKLGKLGTPAAQLLREERDAR